MLSPPPAKLRCRQITANDLENLIELLCEGFPGRKAEFWKAGLDRLNMRHCPESAPRFGYCLDADGKLVGAILLIAHEKLCGGDLASFTNLGSWYVKPAYRAFAHQLAAMALKNRKASYSDVTAAPNTWAVVEQQGYQKYCGGWFFALAALAKPQRGVNIFDFDKVHARADVQKMSGFDLLQRHRAWGCKVLIIEEAGKLSGFVFRRFAIRSGRLKTPAMLVVYAPSQDELIRLAGNLGRHLMWRAAPILIFDANGPIPGLRGSFTDRRGRKFYKGPHAPALCDLADTEYGVFDV